MQTVFRQMATTFTLILSLSAPTLAEEKLVPLNKAGSVLTDVANKRVILKSEVVLREGMLEMLTCLKGTKEHESILAVPTRAQTVHAALLAVGAEPGEPVRFQPEFRPPQGPKIQIMLNWRDDNGMLHRDPAQSWVRHATRRYFVEKLAKLPPDVVFPADKNLKYDEKHGEMLWYGSMTKEERTQFLRLSPDKAFQKVIQSFFDQTQMREMKADFIFAGSDFFKDEETGKDYYQAEAGDLICVANFASSVIDIGLESSATNEGLVFEAYTERIPPIGTPVDIELIPVVKKADAEKPK